MALYQTKERDKYKGVRGFAENLVRGLMDQQQKKRQQDDLMKIKAYQDYQTQLGQANAMQNAMRANVPAPIRASGPPTAGGQVPTQFPPGYAQSGVGQQGINFPTNVPVPSPQTQLGQSLMGNLIQRNQITPYQSASLDIARTKAGQTKRSDVQRAAYNRDVRFRDKVDAMDPDKVTKGVKKRYDKAIENIEDYEGTYRGDTINIGTDAGATQIQSEIEKDKKAIEASKEPSASELRTAQRSSEDIIDNLPPRKITLGTKNYTKKSLMKAYEQYRTDNNYDALTNNKRTRLDRIWDGRIQSYNDAGYKGGDAGNIGKNEFDWNPQDPDLIARRAKDIKITGTSPYPELTTVWNDFNDEKKKEIILRMEQDPDYVGTVLVPALQNSGHLR